MRQVHRSCCHLEGPRSESVITLSTVALDIPVQPEGCRIPAQPAYRKWGHRPLLNSPNVCTSRLPAQSCHSQGISCVRPQPIRNKGWDLCDTKRNYPWPSRVIILMGGWGIIPLPPTGPSRKNPALLLGGFLPWLCLGCYWMQVLREDSAVATSRWREAMPLAMQRKGDTPAMLGLYRYMTIWLTFQRVTNNQRELISVIMGSHHFGVTQSCTLKLSWMTF